MKKIGNEWKKSISVIMSALLVCSSVEIPAQAKDTESWIQKNALTVIQKLEPEVKTTETDLSVQDKKQLAKEETVYVIAKADGSPEKLIVSDWLKNAMGSDKLEDVTELTNITNVKGMEGFEQKEGALGVWDAAGNDIYYQGSIQKELPVDLKVTYLLNGKGVSADELAGQSGKVKIRFDYTNRQKESVMVREKEEQLYVPFVVMTSLVLDNENFRNIEVSNGKVINDGERTIVMGYAMPGLKDNLDIGSEDFDVEELDIPDYVELTADVTDFELATTMTVATNEIFGDMDLNTQEKMDDLSADMDELQDAMNELMDGTAELYDGVLELYDGTGELTDGIDELDDGAEKLNDGARDLKDGAKELYDGIGTLKNGAGALFVGVKQLAEGLATVTKNNEELNMGAKRVFEGMLQLVNAQLAPLGITPLTPEGKTPIEFYASINAIEAKLQAIPTSRSINEQETLAEVTEAVTEATQEEEYSQESANQSIVVQEEGSLVLDKTKNTDDQEEEEEEEQPEQEGTELEAIEETTENQEDLVEMPQESLQEKDEPQEVGQAEVQVKENVNVKAAPSGVSAAQVQQLISLLELLKGTYGLYVGVGGYTQGVDQIYAGVQELMKNAPTLNSGIDALYDGAGRLTAGASELKGGTSELKDGTEELKDGGQELRDGVEELRDGSKELKDGAIEFNDEGIKKLVDMFNGDLQELSDRFEGVKSAAKAYQSFAGISDGVEGNVRFIYKTAGIEK